MIEIETLLDRLKEDRFLFARFLHTLSFLEYIGARKIIKSQNEKEISMDLLAHISEEIRHARVFKKLAEDLCEWRFEGYVAENVLCIAEAKKYFKAIDAEIEMVATTSRLTYAITTILVEERALKIYPILERTLSSLGFSGRVAGILKEEESHLRDIRKMLTGVESVLTRCQEAEDRAFRVFLDAFESVM